MFINDIEFEVAVPGHPVSAGRPKKTKKYKFHNSGDGFEEFKDHLAAAFYATDAAWMANPKLKNRAMAIGLNLRKDIKISKPQRPINPKPTACGSQNFTVGTILSKNQSNVENLEKLKSLTGANVKLGKAASNMISLSICESESKKVLTVEPKAANPKPRDVSFTLRSFDDMIYYIGETLRANGSSPMVKGPCGSPGPLFKTSDRFVKGDYAAEVVYRGEIIRALPAHDSTTINCMNERSSTVMALLNQLLLLNQSEKFLDAPQIIDR